MSIAKRTRLLALLLGGLVPTAAAQSNCDAVFVASSTPIAASITKTPQHCLNLGWFSGTTVFATAPASVVVQGVTWVFQSWSNGGSSLTTTLVLAPGINIVVATYQRQGTQFVPGSLVPFGVGCRGSNGRTLAQTASGTPLVAGAVTYALAAALPTTPTVLMVGVSDQRLFQLPLPFEATPLGAPGCWLYCDHVVMLVGRADGNGAQNVRIAVPGDPSLIGGRLFSQFFAVDGAVNSAGLTSSNAIETRLGGYR